MPVKNSIVTENDGSGAPASPSDGKDEWLSALKRLELSRKRLWEHTMQMREFLERWEGDGGGH
jgi:hypothetical protein